VCHAEVGRLITAELLKHRQLQLILSTVPLHRSRLVDTPLREGGDREVWLGWW
jgi:hypothetical protein